MFIFRMQICTMRRKGVPMAASALYEVAQSFIGGSLLMRGIKASSTLPDSSLISTQSAAPLTDKASILNQGSLATSSSLPALARSQKWLLGAHWGLMDGLHGQAMRYRHMSSGGSRVTPCLGEAPPSWMGYYRELNKYKDAHGGDCNVPFRYKEDPKLGRWVAEQRSLRRKCHLESTRELLLTELGLVWEPYEEAWKEMFQQLKEYKEAHGGDCNVPNTYKENPPLGKWVAMQRVLRKKCKLDPERERLLAELGFVWDPHAEAWEEMFQQLKEYKEAHGGDCNVPQTYKENPPLGIWVKKQRVLRKKCKLEPERERQLMELGLVWEPQEEAWEEMFQQLKEYKEAHGGDCNVPSRYKEDPKLGIWVDTQRVLRKKCKLEPERERQLMELGLVWEPQEEAWEEMFQQLKEYKEAHGGDCNVPSRYKEDPKLGIWVDTQRGLRKKCKLEPERELLLAELGFVWEPHEEAWKEMFLQLKEYKKAHGGDCNVPQTYKENPPLGIWVRTQRGLRKKCKLEPERERQLMELGLVWEPQEEAWEEMFQQLKEYKEAHGGDCNVPSRYKEDPKLGIWVDTQRVLRKKCKLEPERERQLMELGLVWEPQEEAWEEMFQQLKEYKEAHGGDCNVPSRYKEDPKLGIWVLTQRGLRKKCKLEPERERLLAELGFIWGANEESWEMMYLQLKEYQEVHGDCDVPRQYKPNPPLGSWVYIQRRSKAKGKMDPNRQRRLAELGFSWGT